MRYSFKLRPLISNSANDLLHFHLSKLQSFCLQVHSKSSKLHNPKKTESTHTKNQSETNSFASLFDEITGILGTEETHLGYSEIKEEHSYSVPSVRGNATEGMDMEKENTLVLGDTQLGNLGDLDVSPLVHKVTQIVRGESGGVPMEEQLENAGFEIDEEVVEKVLKRCFKVPCLARRFFNWVKMKNGFRHTTRTYNTMIYIAGEAKEFRLVEELVEEMEKNSCPKDCKTWTILILHYGNAKMIGKTLWIYEKMRETNLEPDAVVYKHMLRVLCNAGKAEIALEFYKEMVRKEIGLNAGLYKLLLKSLAQSGDIAAAYAAAEGMTNICEIPEHHAYACLLKSFCIAGRIREALELIRDLKHKNMTLDAEIFETLVKGLCRANMTTDALEIVDIMKSRDSVDGKIYGIIINGFLRRNDSSKAFDLFQSMKDSGHTPTTSTYTELMQHLFRMNEFEKADEIYHEMLEKGVPLDIVAVTAIVAGHIRQNRISEAWEVLKSMEENGIRANQKSYTVFVKELCKVSQTEEIVKVLNKMQDSNIIIPNDISHLVRPYLEERGEMEKLEKVKQRQGTSKLHLQEGKTCSIGITGNRSKSLNSDHIEERKKDPHLLKSFPSSYSDHDIQRIRQFFSSSENWCSIQQALEKCDIKYTPELVSEILHNCGPYSHVALHFFSWVGKQAGYNHTTDTYNMAIKISGRSKDFKHMRSLFHEMRRIGCTMTSDTWTIMLMQYGRAGLTDIALKIFREMKISGCKPNGSTYKYLVVSLCEGKGRKVEEAVTAFHEMIRLGFSPDKGLIEIYLHCLCGVGKLLDARRCLELLKKAGFTSPLTYSMYVRALCRAGRLEEALALVDEVGSDQNTLAQYTYGSLVHGLLRMERSEDALAKVESMRQIGINPTVHVYTSLIVHFFKEKRIDKAVEIFEKMKEEGCEPTIVTYSALIRGYMNCGKLVDAWNVFRNIKLNGPFPDFRTYSMFISCLCKVGKSEEALQLISEMLDRGIVPSAINFRTVFFGLNREGKRNIAHTVLQKKWDLLKRRKFSM